MKLYTHLNYSMIPAVLAALSKLKGYAIQAEPIVATAWLDDSLYAVKFERAEFKRVRVATGGTVWHLVIGNNEPIIFF